MTRYGWQSSWIRILTTLLTVAVMVMIFYFSTEDAEKSDRRSGVIADMLVRMIHSDYEQMQPEEQRIVYDEAQLIVRKIAHFSEYTLLGFLIRLCMESWFGSRHNKSLTLSAIAFSAGTVYACTDEAHQLSTAGRYGTWKDVMVDASGVMTGVLLGTLLIRLTKRNKEKPEI